MMMMIVMMVMVMEKNMKKRKWKIMSDPTRKRVELESI